MTLSEKYKRQRHWELVQRWTVEGRAHHFLKYHSEPGKTKAVKKKFQNTTKINWSALKIYILWINISQINK